ncbi:phage tail-collar fiber domain-containing protein [Laribacter hongkongensis]|uniref:phage tail-collar fiber domain-containing protein n=1 Tax=Laribacter hongkongensis TaxID=168471 RepID=UPI001EFE5EF2|nr:phage tail protein [Laribacter hongkongensis]MCG9031417.1 phage tail protein [Laribacter hongkongensis]MCG9091637.1 phage tail protein [Laribacter hongkongensis]
MPATYYCLLTRIGEAKLARATALGTRLAITHLAVGDGGGTVPQPEPGQTALQHEVRRGLINELTVDPQNPNQILIEQVIPEEAGGWWIREIGAFDADGDLIAVGNCPASYKPVLAEGSGRTQIIRMLLVVSSTDAITLKIDPSVVLATRQHVSDTVTRAISDHQKQPDPHPQYATDDALTQGLAGKLGKTETAADSATLEGHPASYFAKAADLAASGSKPGRLVVTFRDTPEPGTLVCNGAAISRTTYARLFAAIGSIYGAGDGSSTFNLPNIPDGHALLAANGSAVGSASAGEVKSHGHSATSWTDNAGAHQHVWGNNSPAGNAGIPAGLSHGDARYLNWNGPLLTRAGDGAHAHSVGTTVHATGTATNLAAGMKLLVCIAYE